MVRKLTGWNIFVQKVKKENPSLTFGEVLKKASQLKKEGKMDKMSSSSSSSSTSIKNKKEHETEEEGEEEEGEKEGEEEPKHNIKKMKSRHSMKSKTFKKKHNFLQKKLRKTKRKSRKSRRSRKSRK